MKTRCGNKGASLVLNYDVHSSFTYTEDYPNIAYNGYYTKLRGVNLNQYKWLIFFAKGDKRKGFTRVIRVELKEMGRNSPYIVEGITDKWQKIIIPLEKFEGIMRPEEFTIAFDYAVTKMEGKIYIDDIYFSSRDNE